MSVNLSSELSIAELGIFESGSIATFINSANLTVDTSDTLSFLDYPIVYKIPLEILFSDSFTLVDGFALAGIFVSLTQSAADTLANWSDAVSQIYRYLSNFSDTNTFSDYVESGYGLQIVDTNVLSDLAQAALSITLAFGDSAHNWLDLLTQLPNISFGQFEDNFLITDELKVQLHHKLTVGDVNTITDAIKIVFQFLIANVDTITQTDAASVSSNALGALTLNISETLDMSDSLGGDNNVNNPLRSDSFINYLRRYLNDVPR